MTSSSSNTTSDKEIPPLQFGTPPHILRVFPRITEGTVKQYVSHLTGLRAAASPLAWSRSGKSVCAERFRAQFLRTLSLDSLKHGVPDGAPEHFQQFLQDDPKLVALGELLVETGRKMKEGTNTRLKSDRDLSSQVDHVVQWVSAYIDDDKPVTADMLFGVFLPPRRPSDYANFWVCDEEPVDIATMNAYVRSTNSLVFNVYKNANIHGEQRFNISDARLAAISLGGAKGIAKAIEYLHDTERFPEGAVTKLPIKLKPGTLTHRRGGFSNNAFRHAVESRASKFASRAARIYALRFLAHSAHVALHFYSFADGDGEGKEGARRARDVMCASQIPE